ncbi:hypothetical protein GH810_08790 [Acetobacterium paludosum]|uniref:Uncharacterized protein n=1 Tax=Acetobacterium paludosum TaxID=52693 RepID=A0A923I3I1_9FIRM|nr:hypothetical protein [Acetobacterium paludosum]MBC3888405.1 hypothetical protein [Acetobacterium paludosum]
MSVNISALNKHLLEYLIEDAGQLTDIDNPIAYNEAFKYKLHQVAIRALI